MAKYEKVLVLNNQIEADIMEDILKERGIPHLMITYHDIAYDGIFQIGGWGHVEARDDDHQEIREIYQEIQDSFNNEV
ncbi:MAG: hypothetical protein ACLFPF_02310 [Halanaerobiales bacterium]